MPKTTELLDKPTINISQVSSVKGIPETGQMFISVLLSDGTQTEIGIQAQTAHALLPTINNAIMKMVDQVQSGPLAKGDLPLIHCSTVHMGHNVPSKIAAVVFDKGLPSQTAYKLPEKQFWQLAEGVSNTITNLFGKSPDKTN